MRGASPEPERELRALLRLSEPGSYNLENYLRKYSDLGLLDGVELSGPDELLAPRLHGLLEQRRLEQLRADGDVETTRVRGVQESVRRVGHQVVVLPAALFRLASAAKGKKYIRFVDHDLDVVFARLLLVRAGGVLRVFKDVEARIDKAGLHLSWRGGRGRLNFRPQPVGRPAEALVVVLPPPPRTQALETSVRRPTLLGQVLAEMGFGI